MRVRAASRIGLAVVLALAALASWWLWSRPQSPPGPVAAPRVILFAPNLTEAAFALGAGERVIAVTDWCVWPAEALARPRVGGMIDPNLERIAALGPDLLVLQGENPDLRSFARRHGLAVASVKMDDDVASILAGISQLDSLLNPDAPRASRALVATIQTGLAELEQQAAGLAAPRVLFVLSRPETGLDGIYTIGPGSFLFELIGRVGGRNAVAGATSPYFQLSLETLVADPPDVAIEFRPGDPVTAAQLADARAAWDRQGLGEVRVEVVTFDGLLIPGPRVVETARALAAAIHGGEPPR